MSKSALVESLVTQLRYLSLPEPQREVRFHPTRRWRFDLAWPDRRLAVECDGGTWTRGRHTRPQGYARDCEKLNAAAMLGWRVLRFTRDMVDDGAAVTTIERALR